MVSVIEEYKGHKILKVTFEGSKGNSFSKEMLEEIHIALDDHQEDESIAGVVLTGKGRAFSVGGDVFAMHKALEQNDPGIYLDVIVPLIEKLILKIVSYPKPVVAAVNGAAAGAGMSLALACDDVVTIEKAKFGMGFGGLGLTADSGSSVIFSHHFGERTTIHGVATARVFTAKELETENIASIASSDNLIERAMDKIAYVAANGSLHSYGGTKILVNQSLIQQLEHNLPLEYKYIKAAAEREEFKKKVKEIIDKLSQ